LLQHFLAPIISFLVKRWELRTTLADSDPALKPNQYTWAPTDAIISFFELIAETEPILDKINLPVLILHNRQDSVVLPESGDYVYHHLASSPERKSILWLDRSDHQLFCDCERGAAVGAVVEFIAMRLKGSPVFPQMP
jgi:carboxylesterase